MSMNQIFLMGRLTKDPEVSKTNSGVSKVTFSIAVEDDYKPENGEREVDYFDIVAWRGMADFVGQYFTKGRMAVVVGKMKMNNWIDKEGNKRRSFNVVADNIYFGDSKKEGNGNGAAPDNGYANNGYPQQGNPNGGYPQQGNPNGGYQQQNNGGYQQQGNPNGGYQQQNNGGGYQQGNPNGGFQQQNNGGYQQGNGNGGYQQNNGGGYQQQGNSNGGFHQQNRGRGNGGGNNGGNYGGGGRAPF